MKARPDPFAFVIACCATFFAASVLAMLVYPGGSVAAGDSVGYSFFANFFSDLGQTRTHSGANNTPSLVLFFTSLCAVALGLTAFFLAFARLFPWPPASHRLALVGALGGLVTAASFVGVGLTPWNLYLQAHDAFVVWAFRAFLVAVVACAAAVFLAPDVPRRFAWVFLAFGAVLAAYVGLLAFGPAPATASGAAIQAIGQKIVVYASVVTVLVQALAARAYLQALAARAYLAAPPRVTRRYRPR